MICAISLRPLPARSAHPAARSFPGCAAAAGRGVHPARHRRGRVPARPARGARSDRSVRSARQRDRVAPVRRRGGYRSYLQEIAGPSPPTSEPRAAIMLHCG
ncbi:MAG: hypothetical protein DI605_08720 [Sphingomonas sp.]|nr:MAG: hypothetical protein DI605_08720 [Sphingomonas sp.]